MFYGKKVLVVQPDGECYDCGGSSEVRVDVVDTPEALMALIADQLAFNAPLLDGLLSDKRFTDALDQRGFRDVSKVSKQAERAVLEQRYYIADCSTRGYNSIREVDIDNIADYEAEQLAKKDTMLFQSVKPTTLKSTRPKAYKAYTAAKKKLEAQAEARRKTAEKKKAAKKQRELDAAKKLLEEAGEI